MKDIAERAGGNGSFSYSRFFAVGLFRLLELSNATDPTVLEKVIRIFIVEIRKRTDSKERGNRSFGKYTVVWINYCIHEISFFCRLNRSSE